MVHRIIGCAHVADAAVLVLGLHGIAGGE